MSDPLDLASEREEIARQSALVTCRKPEAPASIGCCLYCGERLPIPMRWCGPDCRNEYELDHNALRRCGRAV
jgi:hypothetical protein